MRGLESAPKGQFAVHFVHRRNRTAGLKRARVGAVIVHFFSGNNIGVVDHLIGGFFLAGFPREDVIGVLAWAVRTVGPAGNLVGSAQASNAP